jgi:hypothetical protein
MIKFFKSVLFIISLTAGFVANAQTTSNSPYSQFGLGIIKPPLLPQNRAMGGIAAGLRNIGPVFNNINLANPASYSDIHLTAFDIGASSSLYELSKSNISRKDFNATLSHILFAIPVNKKSALSFGIVPFSDLGYSFKVRTLVDTNAVEHIYSGDGGLSKAYVGYGTMIGKHLSLGFNAGYLFGKLNNSLSTEFPTLVYPFVDPSALNSRTESSNSIGGLNFDYGMQYFTKVSSKVTFTLGYSANAKKTINSSTNVVVTHYVKASPETELSAADTLYYTQGTKVKITMPVTQTFGFSFQQPNKWLFGADFSLANWADYREGNKNPGLKNSSTISAGGQITPNINSSNYLKVIDYRLGFKYDKTYINIKSTDINQTAFTFGFGLPLLSNRTTYYKINFATEIGSRGTLSNNLVRERFTTFNIGFMMNDKWFQKYKFD